MSLRQPTKVPLEIVGAWATRFWTTNPPRYDPRREWKVRLSITSTTPLRIARVIADDRGWTIDKSSERGCQFTFAIGSATEVEPTSVENSDPWLSLGTSAPVAPMTWSLIPLSKGPHGSDQTSLLAFAQRDTETLRGGRWRIRTDLWEALPIESDTLRQGARGTYWSVATPTQDTGDG
jgi:hypothetical protein